MEVVMIGYAKGTVAQYHVFRIAKGKDLVEELQSFVLRQGIHFGEIMAIGAVERATIGYYHQSSRKYETLTFNDDLEITSCLGNISIKDGQPFVHAHMTLADRAGKVIGGHLMPGTIIFACEVIIHEFGGEAAVRVVDDETSLFLWK